MKRILGNTSTAFMIIAAVLLENSYYSQSTLKGHVTEQNSGKKPVAGVMVKSLGANSVVSSNSGEFVLTFQDRLPGMNAVLRVEKEGWEVVNEKELSTLIPATPDESRFKIIVCKVGTLEKSKKEYYTITDKYIQQEYQRKINALNREKEGWQQEAARLGEQYESLQKQLEKMADEYSRINLDDATDIERQAIELFKAGKIDESIQLRESLKSDEEIKKAIIEKKKSEDEIKIRIEKMATADSAVVLHTRNMKALANDYILKLDFANAEGTLEKLALADTTNAENFFEFAYYLDNQNQNNKAIVYYQKSLEIYEQFTKANPQTYDPAVAMTLNNLGTLYQTINDYSSALTAYQKALEIRERLAIENPNTYEPYIADTRNNIGNWYRAKNDYPSALEAYKKSLEIYEQFTKANPQIYTVYVATVQYNLGNLLSDQNDYAPALKAYQKALEIYTRLSIDNPKIHEPSVAKVLNSIGVLYYAKNEYPSALTAYQKALEMYKRFALENPPKFAPYVANTLNGLGNLYKIQNDYHLALLAYQEAVEVYELLIADNPQTYEPYLARISISLGSLYHLKKDYLMALYRYQHALEIYERFAKDSPEVYDIGICKSIVMIGHVQKAYYQPQLQPQIDANLSRAKLILLNYPDVLLYQPWAKLVFELEEYFSDYKILTEIQIMNEMRSTLTSLPQQIIQQKHIVEKYRILVERGNTGYTQYLGEEMGSLCWLLLLEQQYEEAENTAHEALNPTQFSKTEGYDESVEWVNTNLALALLYQGKYREAEAIYRSYKDRPYNNATYREAFIADLYELEKAGITHPDVAKIRELLKQ